MKLLDQFNHPEKYFKVLFKWGILSILMGLIGGFLGAVFHHVLHFVTEIRMEHMLIVLLLPLGGVLTLGWYRLLGLKDNRGTNEIIDDVLGGKPVKKQIMPGIFVASAITHLFGGSAGREGAALQIGASTASFLSETLRLKEKERTVLVMSGMSAVFAGLFGTPLTATLFTMEFEAVGTIFSPALLPCYMAALTASCVSGFMGVHAETAMLTEMVELTAGTGIRVLVLAAGIGILGILMCWFFHKAEHTAKHLLPNPWIRIVLGGVAIVLLTMLVGDFRYNGAGMDMALAAVEGEANWYDFLLKMLFTAITLAAGFKGGEIVPTFCVGATFGCVLGGLLGLDPGFAAALGLVGLFCCATNSPITAIVLSIEMFGSVNLYLFALVCVVAFVLSGNWGLYSSQVIQFSKARLTSRNYHPDEH